MRIFRKMKFLCFLGIIWGLNGLLSFLIEPAYGASDMMWKAYYQEEEIDTIFIGSSLCSATFDPLIYDSRLGAKSFNMGTPMQSIEQNITAVETAFEEHDIKTVIIGMGFFVLQEEPYEDAALTFEKELARNKGGIKGFAESLEYVFSEPAREKEQSVNYWFPWIYNKEGYSWDLIKQNIITKTNIMAAELRGEEPNTAEMPIKGYNPYIGYVNQEEIAGNNSFEVYNQELRGEQLEEFEKLLNICKAAGVDVLVINTPHPDFDVRACEQVYEKNTRTLVRLCEEYGVEYYDFSLAKPEIFQGKNEYYFDYEHLNYEGSQIFSQTMCDFLIRREKGESMEKYFYTVDEYMKNN